MFFSGVQIVVKLSLLNHFAKKVSHTQKFSLLNKKTRWSLSLSGGHRLFLKSFCIMPFHWGTVRTQVRSCTPVQGYFLPKSLWRKLNVSNLYRGWTPLLKKCFIKDVGRSINRCVSKKNCIFPNSEPFLNKRQARAIESYPPSFCNPLFFSPINSIGLYLDSSHIYSSRYRLYRYIYINRLEIRDIHTQ